MTETITDNFEDIPLRRAFRYLKPAFSRTRKAIIFMAVVTVISSSLGLLPPYLGKQLFDKGVMAGETGPIIFYGLLGLGAFIVAGLLRFSAQAMFSIASNGFSLNLKSQIIKRLLILPMEFFDNQRSGYLVSRIGEVDSVTTLFSPSFFQFFASIIEAVGAAIIVVNISSRVTLIMLPFIPVFLFVTMWMSKILRRNTNILRETSALTVGGLQEIISGVTEIKHYDSKGNKLMEILARYKELASRSIRLALMMAAGSGSLGLLTNILSVTIMIFIGVLITRDQLTIGDYVALTGYAMKVFIPVQAFGAISLSLQPAIMSMKRLSMFFESETEQEIWGNKKVSSLKGNISFKDVTFGYNTLSQPVLSNCTFTIHPGESIAIYGGNGSGKSTILKLILGMYYYYQGEICIDNYNLHEYDVESLRNWIGIVSQNTFLFKGNLVDNIRMASPDVSRRELENALELSGCMNIFGDNIDGIEIEEFGKNLSAGQKQAASIARCLLKNPDILMFDEATTHLDNTARKIVLDAFQNTFIDKTRIIITHDHGIAKIADHILLLEEGKIKKKTF